MQILPSPELSPFIRHYLFLNKESMDICKLRLFSDGSTGIVFYSGLPLTLNTLDALPTAFAYGQITDFKDIICHGPVSLFIVVFRPDGLHRLSGLSATEIKDKVIPLADLFGSQGVNLSHALSDSLTPAEKITRLETFFYTLSATTDPLVTTALDLIQKYQGLITIQSLAEFTGCHPRQLERKFRTSIGLSPKKFGNIIRIHTFLKQLKTVPQTPTPKQSLSLTSCAYDSGYFDQAHLIREFRTITGLTPSQYRKKTTPLAVNFLQIPV